MLPGTSFQEILPLHQEERVEKDGEVRRVIICSGKLYWHIMHQRKNNELHDVTLVRIEQLSPFPYEALAAELRRFISFLDVVTRPHYTFQLFLARYPRALASNQIVWAQEEPKNMGPWSYVQPRLAYLFGQMASDEASKEGQPGNVRVAYVGRPPSASPATAQFELHNQEVRE